MGCPASKDLWFFKLNFDDYFAAIFIDIDEDDVKSEDKVCEYSRWSELPDLLLEEIFSYLSIREKYYASLVCRSWHRAFYLQNVWSSFVLEDTTLTRGKFNYYSGWQVTYYKPYDVITIRRIHCDVTKWRPNRFLIVVSYSAGLN